MCPAGHIGDPGGFSKGCSSKFRVGSRVWQTLEEGRRTYRPKRCGNNNKDEDNTPKILNDGVVLYSIVALSNMFALLETMHLELIDVFCDCAKFYCLYVMVSLKYTNFFHQCCSVWLLLINIINCRYATIIWLYRHLPPLVFFGR